MGYDERYGLHNENAPTIMLNKVDIARAQRVILIASFNSVSIFLVDHYFTTSLAGKRQKGPDADQADITASVKRSPQASKFYHLLRVSLDFSRH